MQEINLNCWIIVAHFVLVLENIFVLTLAYFFCDECCESIPTGLNRVSCLDSSMDACSG